MAVLFYLLKEWLGLFEDIGYFREEISWLILSFLVEQNYKYCSFAIDDFWTYLFPVIVILA